MPITQVPGQDPPVLSAEAVAREAHASSANTRDTRDTGPAGDISSVGLRCV